MKILRDMRNLPAVLSASFLLLLVPAKATLLTASYEAELETWLGQGDLDFTNIFTKQSGNTAADFHAAVDGKGATFVLMTIYGTNWANTPPIQGTQIIGGYDPQSWNSSGTLNLTPNDVDRTAFIYNLTSGIIQRQNLIGEGYTNSGSVQTYNAVDTGPDFGNDFGVNTDLSSGGSTNYSYGGNTLPGNGIISGPPNLGSTYSFLVGELEVYTFSPAQGGNGVPDTGGTFGLLGGAMIGLIAFRRRRA